MATASTTEDTAAAAVVSSSETEPSEMECPVCHEHFTTPKILPCAHLLCRQCLVTLLTTEANAECPLCRCVIVNPQKHGHMGAEEIADTMPTDDAMKVVIECSDMLKKGHVCCGCKSAATYICLNCRDMLCCSCSVIHKSMSIARDHEVENLSTLTAERLANKRRTPCVNHPKSTAEVYCPTHGASICYQCVALHHRRCPEVTDLDAQMTKARGDLSDLLSTLKAGETKLEEAIKELDQHALEMEKTTQAAVADIDRKSERLKNAVDEWSQRMKGLVQKANSDTKEEVQSAKEYLQQRQWKLSPQRLLVERVDRAMSRDCALGGLTEKLRVRVQDLDYNVSLPADAKIVTKSSLEIDETTLDRLELVIRELGVIQKSVASVVAQPAIWRFHTNHGKNIVLSNNQRTAERVTGDRDSVVVCADAMLTGRLYEVRVDHKDVKKYKDIYYLVCGVTWTQPEKLVFTLSTADWKSSVTIGGGTWYDGKETEHMIGDTLRVQEGSRVGLLLDDDSCLHVFVDGSDRGVAVRNVKQPCYPFFNVLCSYKKITALPLTTPP